jgi:hypothetical protein
MQRSLYRVLIALACVLGLLSGCASLESSRAPAFEPDARWVLLPIINNTDTPQAGLRAESITFALLKAEGLKDLRQYPADLNPETLFEPSDRKVMAAALDWARKEGARYAVTGAVDEWRYKVGVDGEPAVGVSLRILDVKTGETLWSGVAAKSGWSRQALAQTGQDVIGKLVRDARLPAR